MFPDGSPDLVVDAVFLEDRLHVVDRRVPGRDGVGIDRVEVGIEVEAIEYLVVLVAREHVCEDDGCVGGLRYFEDRFGKLVAAVGVAGTDCKQYCI